MRWRRGRSDLYPDHPKLILLVTVWGKNEKSDLPVRDRNAIAAVVRDIRKALAARGER